MEGVEGSPVASHGGYAALVADLRAAVRGGDTSGLDALRNSHHVFGARAGGEEVVVKLFASRRREEPEREWDALRSFEQLGIAPRPIWFDPGDDLPAVVMSRVPGRTAPTGGLSEDQLGAIGRAHVALRACPHPSPERAATNHPAVLLGRTRERLSALPPTSTSDIVELARARAGDWLATGQAADLARPSRLVLCRGDSNLVNYLFEGDDVRLVDFEDSGMNDPAFELADMVEHLNARAVPETSWRVMEEVLELGPADRLRYRQGRRLMAIFWLTILVGRDALEKRRGPETPEEQAERVLSLLDTPAG